MKTAPVGLEPTKCSSQSAVPYHLGEEAIFSGTARVELALQVGGEPLVIYRQNSTIELCST